MAYGATAQAQLEAGQVMEARRSINKALSERDDIADLHLLRAHIELALNSYDTAFNAYSNALALDATNSEAMLGIAQLGLRNGHLYESEQAADRILTLDPNQSQALLVKGLHNLLHNRNEDALKNADDILAQTPRDENGTILRVRTLAMLGRPEDALNELLTLKKENGETQGVAKTLLELYRQKGDAPAMITQFNALRKFTPGDKTFDLDEANTLYKMGQAPRARALLNGLLFDPRLTDKNVLLIVNLWNEYDADPLDPATLNAIGTKGGPAIRTATARFYLARGDADRARVALGNGVGDNFTALGAQVDIAKGDVAAGMNAIAPLLQKDETNCDALLAKAEGDLVQRNFDDAVIASQSANANCPKMTPVYVILAKAQEASRNKAAADLAFQSGVDRNVQDSRLARIYADWLIGNGKAMRAVSIARRVTRSAPALISGWKLYEDVCTRVPDAGCAEDAKAGLEAAQQRFAVDLRPDELAPVGLYARLGLTRE